MCFASLLFTQKTNWRKLYFFSLKYFLPGTNLLQNHSDMVSGEMKHLAMLYLALTQRPALQALCLLLLSSWFQEQQNAPIKSPRICSLLLRLLMFLILEPRRVVGKRRTAALGQRSSSVPLYPSLPEQITLRPPYPGQYQGDPALTSPQGFWRLLWPPQAREMENEATVVKSIRQTQFWTPVCLLPPPFLQLLNFSNFQLCYL